MRRFQPSILGLTALAFVACDGTDAGPTSEDLAQVAARLDTTDERLAGLETKVGELDGRLAQIATWAEERKAEAERREQERAERVAELERLRAERAAARAAPEAEDPQVEWLTCKESEDAVMTCLVTKADFEDQLANPAAMARWARVVPSQRDGRTVGFKFYAIRPSSPLYAAGVKSGDLLSAIDGKSITSIDAAMEAYVGLRKATSLRFDFERRGKPWTLELEVVE